MHENTIKAIFLQQNSKLSLDIQQLIKQSSCI